MQFSAFAMLLASFTSQLAHAYTLSRDPLTIVNTTADPFDLCSFTNECSWLDTSSSVPAVDMFPTFAETVAFAISKFRIDHLGAALYSIVAVGCRGTPSRKFITNYNIRLSFLYQQQVWQLNNNIHEWGTWQDPVRRDGNVKPPNLQLFEWSEVQINIDAAREKLREFTPTWNSWTQVQISRPATPPQGMRDQRFYWFVMKAGQSKLVGIGDIDKTAFWYDGPMMQVLGVEEGEVVCSNVASA